MSDRELIASHHKDWQYVESIVRKITVLTLEDYEKLDYREREKSNLFFMRSRLDEKNNVPKPEPPLVCHCLKPYNPDEKIVRCCTCRFEFHSICARHQYLCINCQWFYQFRINKLINRIFITKITWKFIFSA